MIQVLLVLCMALSAIASPLPQSRSAIVNNGITRDAPYSTTPAQRSAVPVICPNGVQKAANKNILFVHGTGGTGDESWASGMIPAFYAKGYNGCYINMPGRTLGDAQISSEYVASAIQSLYSMTGNKQILLIGHSQGNLNIQWALNFWPSTRSKVASYVSFSGDFQGTGEGPLLAAIQNLAVQGTDPSVLQQSVLLGHQSNFLQALNKRGNKALVPTTSLYGIEDEIIQPVAAATVLGGGGAPFTRTSIQALCPLQVVDHFEILINSVAFYLALDAFTYGGAANLARAKQNYDLCSSEFAPGIGDFAIPDTVAEAFKEAIAAGSEGIGTTGGLLSQRTALEPPLKSYALQ